MDMEERHGSAAAPVLANAALANAVLASAPPRGGPSRPDGSPPGRLPRHVRIMTRLTRGLPPPACEVGVRAGLVIPGDGGVPLLADHYVPLSGGPWPTLLVRSPYGRGFPFSTAYGAVLARQGFHVIVQSCRGTAGSGGEVDPGRYEAADGLAAVAWLREQDWFTGELATIGPSYLGYVQWALAADPPPELRAMVVHNGLHDLGGLFYPGGALALETLVSGSVGLLNFERGFLAFARAWLRTQRRLRRLSLAVPLADAFPRMAGARPSWLDEWLARPDPADPYWADRRFPASPALGAAVSLVSGWADTCLDQTLEQYARLRDRGADVRLLIGPWNHGNTTSAGAAEVFGDAVAFLHSRLGTGLAGLGGRPAVRIHVGGPGGGWRNLAAWPPPARQRAWYPAGDGRLGTEPPAPSVTRFRYAPADPTPAAGGQLLNGAAAGRVRNRRLEARPDVRVFTSAPLTAPVEVIGPVSARLTVASGSGGTVDVFARLCDVDERGRSWNVCDGLARLTATAGGTGVTVPMSSAAYRFAAGHRLRLQVSGGAHPRFGRSTGTGEPLATATRLIPADIEIRHGDGALLLPVTSPGWPSGPGGGTAPR